MQSSSVAVARLTQRVIDTWYEYQVELHGQYSAARLLGLHTYSQTTRLQRMMAVCFATPLLALALIIAVDCIPLAPPDAGASANYVFWCRNLLTVAFMTYGPIEQFQQIARTAAFSSKQIAVVAVVASMTGVGFQFLLSLAVGFPLPFSLACGLPIWMLVLFLSFVAVHFDSVTVASSSTNNCVRPVTVLSPRGTMLVAHEHDLVRERVGAIVKYARVFVCQASLVFVYPAYIYAFQALSPVAQTFFVLVLPLIKIVIKNCLCYLLGALDDIKPEFVIINIEVFHAFYVSCCMQSALSSATTLCLTLVDWCQAWLSIRDVRDMVVDLNRLLRKVPQENALHGQSCIEIAQLIVAEDPAQLKDIDTPTELYNAVTPPLPVMRHRAPTLASLNDIFSDAERLVFAEKTAQLLFTTEFLILIEFTEVIVPVMYGIYIFAVFHLPNRAYYPQLAAMDVHELSLTLATIALYASLELLSLIVLCRVLRRNLGISSLTQLAFVLDMQWSVVQAKLLLWIFYAVQNSLVHFGADFSFRFAWLRAQQPR